MKRNSRVKYIVLIGFMGSGKTTTGRALAKRLKMPFCDLDAVFKQRSGMTPGACFKAKGEAFFRRLESNILQESLKKKNKDKSPWILATGGGVVLQARNRRLLKRLKQAGVVEIYWLNPTWKVIWSRLKKECRRTGARKDRPLLWDEKRERWKSERAVRAIWSARRKLYQECSDY